MKETLTQFMPLRITAFMQAFQSWAAYHQG